MAPIIDHLSDILSAHPVTLSELEFTTVINNMPFLQVDAQEALALDLCLFDEQIYSLS